MIREHSRELVSLLRCEGGDDFFEARIGAERIPNRQQL